MGTLPPVAWGAYDPLDRNKSREPGNTRKPIKTRIKTQDSMDFMLLHDGEMERVTG